MEMMQKRAFYSREAELIAYNEHFGSPTHYEMQHFQ
jgi:hypothetical protein